MATFTASAAQATVQPKAIRVGLVAVRSTYSIGAAPSAGDIIQMVKVPAGATPIHVNFACTNNTPSFILEVGDGILSSRYRSVATYSIGVGWVVAQANTAVPTAPYTYSADDTIDVFISTVTASNATIGGAFHMNVIFSMDAEAR